MNAARNWLIGGSILMMVLIMPPAQCRGTGLPDSVTLDSLARLYEPVPFNHAKHIQFTKDCGVCHHHTTGTLVEDSNCIRCHRNSNETKIVACKGCHVKEPFAADALKEKSANLQMYHLDKPGLKGAYHQSCMGCHAKMGGPVDCGSCHKRTREGDALYNSGPFVPQKSSGAGKHH